MRTKDKEKKTIYITHSGELLFWLIIILIIVSISSLIISHKSIVDNDYTIFMNDVDGLIIGSPVRAMGIEIGHITKIEPATDEVYIKFIITEPNIIIPQGTVATVEFSGMAGSKSLELYLPDDTTYISKNIPIITVNPPKRLHDSAGLLNEMFDKIGSIIYTSSAFTKKLNFSEIKNINSQSNINDFLKYANTTLDNSNEKIKEINYKKKD